MRFVLVHILCIIWYESYYMILILCSIIYDLRSFPVLPLTARGKTKSRIWSIFYRLGSKNPIYLKKSKDFTCKRYWRIDSVAFKSRSKSKKFDVFDPSHPFHSPKRNQFYLSDIELTFGNTLVHFSKKSKPKKFWPKSLNLP